MAETASHSFSHLLKWLTVEGPFAQRHLMNSSFILIFVQPTEAPFSNVFHSYPPQKQKTYYL